jgi:hypothetical protein
MRNLIVRKFNLLILVSTIAACLVIPLAFAQQIQNPIQAAKDAYNKAKRQQQQTEAPSANSPSQPAAQGSSSSVSSGDCCSPKAMKKIADSLGYLDIVGVKLGMGPEQAFAAIKANPKLKIDIINARLERPGVQGFVRVPGWAVAHTVNPNRLNVNFVQPDGSAEAMGLEFTTPPSPPMVAKIVRVVTFPRGQPVAASNLVEALRKKYGQESYSDGGRRVWIFDASGKQVTRVPTADERLCMPSTTLRDFPNSNIPTPDDLARDGGTLDLAATTLDDHQIGISERLSICRPYTFVESYGIGEDIAPNTLMRDMTVTMQSGALMYNSRKATHDWLQGQADALIKQQKDAAAKRSAPKL